MVPSLKFPKVTQHLFGGPLWILEPYLVQDVVSFKARGKLSPSLLSVSFTRKDKMYSSKALLYYIHIVIQMYTALAAPDMTDLAYPIETAYGLPVDTPFVESKAAGRINRRQVDSHPYPLITTKFYGRIKLRRLDFRLIPKQIAAEKVYIWITLPNHTIIRGIGNPDIPAFSSFTEVSKARSNSISP